MTEFRTTATHDGRAVPTDAEVERLAPIVYRAMQLHAIGAEEHKWVPNGNALAQDDARRAVREILADARASAAPSEDAIRAAKWETLDEVLAFLSGQGYEAEHPNVVFVIAEQRRYAPRPAYAAPVRLSDGRTFGQTGPDAFELARSGVGKRVESAKDWRLVDAFTPADGALVLAVLDGAEATR